jgi:hypothetical protein
MGRIIEEGNVSTRNCKVVYCGTSCLPPRVQNPLQVVSANLAILEHRALPLN